MHTNLRVLFAILAVSVVALPPAAKQAKLPYTAEFKTTRVQTLADGSTITHDSTEVMVRDAQGRTANIRIADAAIDSQAPRTIVSTYDPASHTHTSWVVGGQTLNVNTDPASASARTSCAANTTAAFTQTQPSADRPKPVFEELGTQTFLGVEARGRRTSTTYPAGSVGNSDQLLRTDETWFSTTPGLAGINVRQINDDPQTGRTIRELVKFTPGDPDPSLFQPPDGYTTITHEIHEEVRCP
jgi:hypothetical protein